MKRIFTLLVFSVSLFLAFSCNSSTTESQVVASEIQEELISKNISAQEFQRLIKDRKEAIILDVRTADEVAEGTIGQAKHLDFYGENFNDELNKLDKNKPILVYCRSGRRSGIAMVQLRELGFSEVYNLEGGIIEWGAAKMEIVK